MVVFRDRLVCVLVNVTVALGTMAPLESFTVPLSWAVTSAANPGSAKSTVARTSRKDRSRKELTGELRMNHLWNEFFYKSGPKSRAKDSISEICL